MVLITTSSPEETLQLGERLAPYLRPGSVVALRGGLGAGKTCLVKGIARGLGITEEVTSPTYTIISEYAGTRFPFGTLPLYHIDAYRLTGDDDFAGLGGEEILYGSGISVIEWSERLPRSLPPEAITIDIEICGGENRTIRITGVDAGAELA
ncbi:tRNA (adenosine(37)-N6)-threonylcarbamoyltransferase complex ATPase subunit type 1 TsaE [Spirochaetia bacterium]|nr:tRNA (adenosine(37)-N6)-threonylcarbamoyltransferase complex ATPase subunit type 1 TsaE [Spirochaetia bacterium]